MPFQSFLLHERQLVIALTATPRNYCTREQDSTKMGKEIHAETYRLSKLCEERGAMGNMRGVCVIGWSYHRSIDVNVGV